MSQPFVEPPASVPPPPMTEPGPASVPWTIPESIAVFAFGFLGAIVLTGAASLVVPSAYAVPTSLLTFNVALISTTVGFVALRHPGQARLLFGSRRPGWRDVGIALAAGVGAYLAINVGLVIVLSALAGALGFELPETQQGLRESVTDPLTAPWVVASAVALAPFAEELFFRGMLFQASARRFGIGGGTALSAAAFTLVHLQASPAASAVVFLAILPLGVLLGLLFARRHTLLVVVVVHAVFNAVGALGLLSLS